MAESFNLNQDNLLLQLKNMPKPPISKELAKEIGFDTKKYETIIEKLLVQISEVRKERIKENNIFEEKIKAMQNLGQNKNKKIVMKNNNINIPKNNNKNHNKNLKINLNRPKSNYKSVKSSGYGMPQKKIDIFSTRAKKKIIDINNTKNNHVIKNNNNHKLIPKSKTNNNVLGKINNNIINKEQPKNSLENNKINKNNIKINNVKNENKNQIFNLNKIKNEMEKIKNENKIIEDNYSKIKSQNDKYIGNKNKNKILNKNNYELIQKNIEGISSNIINGLLYELIDDLKNIEDKKKEREKENIQKTKIKNVNNKLINKKFKIKPDIKLIERCTIYRNKFLEYMKLKGSFLTNNIFKIYDDFTEEISKEILEQGLNYCIEQMDNFINKMEFQK